MKSNRHLALYAFALMLLNTSCTREEILTNLEVSRDCEVRYAAEKRLKKITSTFASTGTVRIWEFSYLKNAVKNINTTRNGISSGNHVIQKPILLFEGISSCIHGICCDDFLGASYPMHILNISSS